MVAIKKGLNLTRLVSHSDIVTALYCIQIYIQLYSDAEAEKTQYASRYCIPESFCASGKFLRVNKKLAIKSSLNY